MVEGKVMTRGDVVGVIVVVYERVRVSVGGRVLLSCLFLDVCPCWCVLDSIPGDEVLPVYRERSTFRDSWTR